MNAELSLPDASNSVYEKIGLSRDEIERRMAQFTEENRREYISDLNAAAEGRMWRNFYILTSEEAQRLASW